MLITPTSDALGTITRTDDDDTADSGSDQYSISQQETSTGTVVSETDDDDDSDGGQDEAIVTDKGEIDTNETDPGTGTVTIGVDKFTFNDDSPENYNDSDEGTAPLSTYDNFSDGTETDDYNTGDGGSDTYSAGDIDTTTTIVTSPYGGTRTTTDTDTLGDNGIDHWSDSFGDNATLPGDEPGVESDDDTFGESGDIDDTFTDNDQIVIITAGLMAAGDDVEGTETITFTDNDHTTDDVGDTGTEDSSTGISGPNPAPATDDEQDTATDTFDEKITEGVGDVRNSVETLTASDGTVTVTTINNNDQDTIGDEEKENTGDGDKHTDDGIAGVGSGEVIEDDDPIDNENIFSDAPNDNDSIKIQITSPNPNNGLNSTITDTNLFTDNYSDDDHDIGEDDDTGTIGPSGGTDSDDEHDIDTDTMGDDASDTAGIFGNATVALTDRHHGARDDGHHDRGRHRRCDAQRPPRLGN